MNQWVLHRKSMFVTMILFGATLVGLVGLALASGGVAADTLLLETSYKDASPRKVSPGGTVSYAIVLQNTNPVSATGAITVLDPLDVKLDFVVGTANVEPYAAGYDVPSAAGVKFVVDPISPGNSVTLTFQATITTTVTTGEVITNTATITEGLTSFTRSVTITVDDLPTAQINVPWNDQLITARGTFTVSGRTWNGEHPDFPEPPVLDPIVNGNGANDWYLVQWSAVPNAIAYVLEEATDVHFETITAQVSVGGSTTSHNFTDQPRGHTYYYRVKARTLQYESRWSAVKSVTVDAGALQFELAKIPVLQFADAAVAVDPPTVEINIKKVGSIALDNWQPATTVVTDPLGGSWWDWAYGWTLPVEDDAQEYRIQVRAKGVGGDYDPAKIDTITVTIHNGMRFIYMPMIYKRYPPVPYAPTLKVDSNDTYGNYQLSWSYNYTDPFAPTSYRFQEATDAAFTQVTLNQVVSSPRSFSNKSVGTYYYRVRGINTYGEGTWSNVQTIVVNMQGFFDDFSDVNSGWPRQVYWRDTQPVDGPVFDVNYENGSYRAKILLNVDSWNNRRMGIVRAPYVNPFSGYDVEVKHRFAKAEDQVVEPTAGKAGLIFAATDDYKTIYVIEWNFEGSCAVSKYTEVTEPTTIINFEHITYLRGWGQCGMLHVGYDQFNTVSVSVVSNSATIKINGSSLGNFDDSGIASFHKVGLMTGSWDRTPVESRFDDFRVAPH